MIKHYSDITLDLDTAGERAEVWAKQDDADTRIVTASFVNAGAVVALTGVSSAELRVLRPDGKMSVTPAQISGNTVRAVLTEQALAVGGEGYGDIRLLGADGECISAARFILHIGHAAVSNEKISRSSEFTALLGGLSFALLTRAEYDAESGHSPTQVTYVQEDDGSVTQYLGDIELSSGSSLTYGLLHAITKGITTAPYGTLREEDQNGI